MAGYSFQDSDPSGSLGNILGVPVKITSGLRSPQHNAAVGGVPNSAHLVPGQAYDFVPNGLSTSEATQRLAQSGIPFDQIEDGGDHVHISFAPTNRRQVIKAKMAQPSISDDDLMKALTGQGGASKPASSPSPQGGPTDDQLLAALTGGAPSTSTPAATGKPPSGNYFPPGDSRNGPAALTIGGDPPTGETSTPAGSTLADVLRAVPGGLVKGASAVAGLPGDVNALLDAGANALTGQNISTRQLPTSQEIGSKVAAPFGGFYEPKTVPGQYADTISQFAPAALAPGNALLRAARVAAPGIGSEAAGQLTKGDPIEPVARFAGALAGGGALGAARSAIENPKPSIPTTSDIKSAATAAYKRAEQAGVLIKQSAVKDLGNEINQAVTEAGIDPTLHPKATAAVKRLVDSKGDLSLKQMDILRRVANGAAGSIDKDESRIAHIVLDHIDDFVENLGSGHVLSGDTEAATSAIKEARSLWAKQAKSSVLDELTNRAKNRAEVVGGSGLENALRVEFRQLAQNAKRMSRFSADEQDAIRKVARGGPVANLARTVGKLAPTNLMAILGEMGAIHLDPKALALPVAGTLGRVIATAATKKNALAASELVRAGGNKIPQTPVFTPEMLSALLSRKSQQEQAPQNNLIPSFAQ